MKIKFKLKMAMLLVAVILVGASPVMAFPGQTNACDGCHTISPSINVTTNVTSITVSPNQSFTVGISWSGGLAGTAGTTEVNWPTSFTNIGITRDNAQFNPIPLVPAPSPAGASGTTQSTLTAPATPGNYIIRVYTSSGLSPSPDGTNFSDINVTVTTPVVVPVVKTITVSPPTATLNVSETQVFNATALDQNSTPMAGVNITWMVSNSTVGNVSPVIATTGADGNASTMFTALAIGTTMVNATSGNVTGNASVSVIANVTTNVTAPTPKLTLTLNNTMDDNPPIVNNITNAVLLDTSGNTVATAALSDNMTAQFNLSGISPGDYFIEVNGLAADHLPTRIDSNASDINQSAGLELQNSVIGDISNPTYRIVVFPSGLDSHPVVNYATGLNESIYNFVIVPGNTSRIEVRVLNTSAELSNFSTTLSTHDGLSVPFQKWILGDFMDSTGAFIGNHGLVYNNTDSNCNTCHGNLSTKASTFSNITTSNGWCFRCHNGKTGPDNGFIDPRVAAANSTIAGNVTNASNGSAISGATVTANGKMATTDANGSYNISIAAGTYNVTANATGYLSNTTTGVVVTSGNVTTQDFALTPTAAQVIVPVLTTIIVSPSTATLNVSGTQVFNATALDQNSTPIAGVNISWTIDNSSVGNVSPVNTTTGSDGNTSTMFTALAAGTAMVNATSGNVTGNATVSVTANVTTNVTVPTPKLTLTLNNTMDGTSPPLVSNITSAVLLDTSGNNVETATLPDNMTAQFNLSGISPGDYFIEVNGFTGNHLPTRIDSNASDINQSVGLRLRNSIIGNISNPTYRIKVYSSGSPPVVNSSHPVVNYNTGLNESIFNFVIVPGNTSRIEVRALNTSEELSNFTPFSDTHPAGANFSSEPFQIWILGDIMNSTGAFIGNHGHLYNNTDSNCNTCHGNLSTKASNFSDISTSNGWCFRCHYGKTGPRNGFVDPRAVVAAANGTIAGNVTNASNGSAISGATVTADGMIATTDANGSYSISIAAGTYNMTASATGYQTNTTTNVVVTSGNVTPQDFALTPLVIPTGQTFNISGFKINNATGSGVPGWNITLMNSTMQTSMLTDMNGSYMFTGLVNGTYNVSEEMKPGFTPVGATLQGVTINGSDVTNVSFTNNPISAINRTFVADLTGGEEVPPEVTLARGNATFNLSDDGTVLHFKVTVANITNATLSHIHLAPVGVNGSIVVNLFTGPTKTGRFDGVLAEGNITQADLIGPLAGQPFSALINNMTNGSTYVNVHTTQHPAGEIRGQIRVAPAPNARFSISGFKINIATDSGIRDWNITLRNGTTNALIDSKPTDANGFYQFIVLVNGSYNVSEEIKPGFIPVGETLQPVAIAGQDAMNVTFTNQPPPSNATFNISGFKINDTNGNGVWDSGEMGIENWNIMLLNNTGVQLANTSTNASGFYQFMNIFPGNYNVAEEMKAGFNSTNATSMPVTVENMDVMNVNFTNNVTVPSPPPTTFNISGFKINNATGSGVPGWNITLTNSTMQISMLTGADGSYMFTNLANDTYNVTEELKTGWMNVSPMSQQVTINGANMMNINFTNQPPVIVTVPTFNISGFKINNATGSGVPSWNITLTNSTMQTSMLTGADGSYMFTNLANDTYNVTEEIKAGWTNVSPMSQQVTIAGSDMMNINFTNQPPTAVTFNISGFKINDTNGNGVWDPGEMGLENWNFSLFNATGALIDRQSTDSTGLYQFTDVSPGTYNVTEEMKAGFTSTNATSMPVTVENMDVTNVNFTNNVTVPPPPSNVTFNISGFKINDTDGNGVWDPGEMGIENWNIMLLNDTGVQLANTSTNAQGFYQFMNIFPGKYNVAEEVKAGFTSTNATSMPVTVENMDVMNVNFTNNVTVPPPPPTTFNISGFKVNDTNGNGVWEPGEMGIENWNIMLLDDKGTQIASTSTDAQGFYQFTNLAPGTYNVTEEMKEGFTPISDTSKEVTIKDMDIKDVNFLNMMVTVTPTPPPQATFTISGFKVNDTDGDGIWEPGEMGIEGWNIMLLDDKGTQIASTSTDAQGFYQFTNLFPGTYKVTEEMRAGFTPTSDTSKEITIKDMDVKDVNFLNTMVTVTPTPTPTPTPPQVTNTISGFKINDLNGNGKQDAGENGLSGWEIELMGIGPETHKIRKETTTDNQGFYKFEDLPAGKYLVKETLKRGYVPTGSPVIVVNLENGMNSMNNNFMNRPVSSLIPNLPGVSAKNQKEMEKNQKDMEDKHQKNMD